MSNRFDMSSLEAKTILDNTILPQGTSSTLLDDLRKELDAGVDKGVGPTMTSVHSVSPFGEGNKKKRPTTFVGTIAKVDATKQQVFGWATIAEENGKPHQDRQGDIISPDAMEEMAYAFVQDCRVGGVMHERKGIGTLIESMCFTKEKQDKLEIDLGFVGWWVGFQVTDPQVWAKVKDGTYSAFSIHGMGIRTKIE